MKKQIRLLPLLLALLMLLSACAEKGTPSTTDPQSTTAPAQDTPPLEDSRLIGHWYSENAYMVFSVKGDGEFDYYPVLMDSYAYAEEIVTGSYVIAGATVTFHVGENDMAVTYNAADDSLTSESGAKFTRTDVLPAKLEQALPENFKGIWYFEQAQAVFDLHTDGTMDYYRIQAGYYTYTSKQTVSYTVTDATIAVTIGETKLALIYNTGKDSLVSTSGMTFVRQKALPTEHPTYTFPNFIDMDRSFLTLGSYKNLTASETVITNATIDIFNEYYQANKAKKPHAITEDRAARYGDVVVIDYTGYLNGEPFSNGSALDQTVKLITNSGYIAGFAEGVIGHKMGETFNVPVTFPEDYHNKDMAGKSVIFTMTLDTIYDLSLTDGEVAAYSKDKYTTYDAWLADVAKSYRLQDMIQQILDASTYQALPESAYRYFYQDLQDTYHYYAFYYNYEYTLFLAMYGLTDDMLKKEAETMALKYIISQAIYEKEGLQYTQESYNEKLEIFIDDAMDYFKYTREEAKKFVLENEASYLEILLVQDTVNEWLLANNQ